MFEDIKEAEMKRPETEEIFKNYKNKIYGLALSITRNEADAEDIVQSTFIKIMNNINRLRNPAYLSSWIYKIAYNESLMSLRKRAGQLKLNSGFKDELNKGLSGLFINWSKMPDKHLLEDEFKERVNNAVRRLPIKYRLPLVLRYVEGMHGKEASSILKLKIASFKTRLHRARMMIEKEIGDYLQDKLERTEEKEPPKCGIWKRFLYSYGRGDLGEKKKKAFDRHIKDCPGCKSFLKEYARAMRFTECLECRDMPVELEAKVSDFLSKGRSRR